MADVMSILQNAYAAGPPTPSKTKYVPVDPAAYQGSWSGTFSNNQKFEVTILIGNSQFRIGDTKFVLAGAGKAVVAIALTNPVTGQVSLIKGNATQDT